MGERIGQATGFTLCGVARDAGCRLPMLLLTREVCRWTAARAARLRVSVLWQPVPAGRLAKTLSVMLPLRPCLEAEAVNARTRAAWMRDHDRWSRSRTGW